MARRSRRSAAYRASAVDSGSRVSAAVVVVVLFVAEEPPDQSCPSATRTDGCLGSRFSAGHTSCSCYRSAAGARAECQVSAAGARAEVWAFCAKAVHRSCCARQRSSLSWGWVVSLRDRACCGFPSSSSRPERAGRCFRGCSRTAASSGFEPCFPNTRLHTTTYVSCVLEKRTVISL